MYTLPKKKWNYPRGLLLYRFGRIVSPR
jgi:hypothetical protein